MVKVIVGIVVIVGKVIVGKVIVGKPEDVVRKTKVDTRVIEWL